MKLQNVLLLVSLAFQYSTSKVITTEDKNFQYDFYCSKSNGNLCSTIKNELTSALNSISTLTEFSPAIKFDAVVDNVSKYRNDTTKEVFAATVNTQQFTSIDETNDLIQWPYPNAKKIIKKIEGGSTGKNYTEDDFILLLNNFKSDKGFSKYNNEDYKNYAIKEMMIGLRLLNKLKPPYDSVVESGIPKKILEMYFGNNSKSINSKPPSNLVKSYEMKDIYPFIFDLDVCNILERNRNETLLSGIMNTEDKSCEKVKLDKLHTIIQWKDRLISQGHSKNLSKNDYKRIVVLGDIHGDYEKLVKLLRHAKIINKKNQWIAKRTILVQIGDLMDRGDGIIKIFDLVENLKKQAPKKNSIVHLLLGNHEIYNMRANYFFTATNDIKSFGSLEKREKALSHKGKYGKLIREDMEPVLTIDDSLFVHAGLYPEFIENGIDHFNDYVHQILKTAPSIDEICELKKKGTDHPLYTDPILAGSKSPFDNRDFSSLPEKEICPEVEKTLKMTNTKRMIIGHTVQQYGEMQSRCNNQLLVIDIGMTYCYGDYFGYVEILNDKNEVWFRYNN